MNPKRGYYSLIQFCPDLSRLEAVNVGVILFCPEGDFLKARITKSNDRARRVFGAETVRSARLKAGVDALAARLTTDRANFRELADLERFAATRANDLLVTAPRSVKVIEPSRDIEALFDELVGERAHTSMPSVGFPVLENLFSRLAQERRAVLDYEVVVPVANRRLRVPYAYQNERWHLVMPEAFAGEERPAIDKAMRLAVEGDLLYRHTAGEQKGQKRLTIVPSFQRQTACLTLESQVRELLGDYEVDVVPSGGLDEFVARVELEAHA